MVQVTPDSSTEVASVMGTGRLWNIALPDVGLQHRTQSGQFLRDIRWSNRLQLRVTERSCIRATSLPLATAGLKPLRVQVPDRSAETVGPSGYRAAIRPRGKDAVGGVPFPSHLNV